MVGGQPRSKIFCSSFLILFVFIVKFLGWLLHAHKEEVAALPPLTKDQELLAEIRDLLKNRAAPANPPV